MDFQDIAGSFGHEFNHTVLFQKLLPGPSVGPKWFWTGPKNDISLHSFLKGFYSTDAICALQWEYFSSANKFVRFA